MKRFSTYDLPIFVIAVFTAVFTVFTLVNYYVQTKPSETLVTWFQGELISVEQTDQGFLVTIDNSEGSDKHPGTQTCLIHSQTRVYDTEFSELAKGSIGMIVTIQTDPFYKADYAASEGDFVFSAKHFRIHLTPPSDPTGE